MNKISFELLPVKNEADMQQLLTIVDRLSAATATFYSIASEISGAPAQATIDTTKFLQQHVSTPLMPHLTCSTKTRKDVRELLDQYLKLGIKKLLVLRGNALPTGDFNYASELVKFIADYTDQFSLAVAVYPEDVNYLPQKIAAGASSAITQFFYDITLYEKFMENCAKSNIRIPIVPGILPITDAHKTIRLAKQCGVTIPKNFLAGLESFAHDEMATLEFGIDIVTRLCDDLLALGSPGLHFFTLNKTDAVLRILKELNYEA